jgi:hypothetical protein
MTGASFWTYQPSEPTPTVDDLPPGTFNGTQSDFEKLSPGMRREIARTARRSQKGKSNEADNRN